MTTESPRWFTSAYSDNGGACVEVAANLVTSHDLVPVRDSKNPDSPALGFETAAWSAFVSAVKRGEFSIS